MKIMTMLPEESPKRWLAFLVLAIVSIATVFHVAGLYGRRSALVALEAQGRTDAGLKVALLRAVLERPRALPLLLGRDRDVEEALMQPGAGRSEALSRKLEELVRDTNAAVIYVIDAKGIAISASNWREATSFVGSDYTFRAYFARGMREGRAEHFALGTVSKRPGLYISQRVGSAEHPLGIVVVKMEFDGLENEWRDAKRAAFVTDDSGVVLISSIASWRFMTTAPLPSAKVDALRESLQYGQAPLLPLSLSTTRSVSPDLAQVRAILPGQTPADYLMITQPVVSTPWHFRYLVPTGMAVAAAVREARLTALAVLVLALATAAVLMRRRQAARMAIIAEQKAREELEQRVTERTRDLRRARDTLQAEISNHQATEARLQTVQQDLVQANRLAILGQVAAGVAHEINQPVATIRAYADNAKVFLDRNDAGPVAENLDMIAALTERIGAITNDLRALARRGRTAAEPVDLRDAMESALMLLKTRFTGSLDRLTLDIAATDVRVKGSRLRLEQVFINLFQNALEAIHDRDGGHVRVSAEVNGATVLVTVADNGPGIDEAILSDLFQPFNSSKEKGLGLGLVICKDIVTDYGGHITVDTGAEGTRFAIQLQKA